MNTFPACFIAFMCASFAALAGESACTLPSEILLRIARADEAAFCQKSGICKFVVMENERDKGCAVQVWRKPNEPDNFVILVISNKGLILERIP
jgi:hypothetical protein